MPNDKSRWLTEVSSIWKPKPLDQPLVDPQLPRLTLLQRSAEALRYITLKAEYWMSSGGTLREWLRLNCCLAMWLGIPACLITPIVTFLLTQFTTWTQLLVRIAQNLIVFPLLGMLGLALLTGLLFALKFLLSSR